MQVDYPKEVHNKSKAFSLSMLQTEPPEDIVDKPYKINLVTGKAENRHNKININQSKLFNQLI